MTLQLENAALHYKAGRKFFFSKPTRLEILQNIDLLLSAGKIYALVGESASGKSSLMRILAGEETDFGGTLSFDGEPVPGRMSRKELKKRIAYIRQDAHVSMDRGKTVRDFISGAVGERVADDIITERYAHFGFDHIGADRLCGTLSGGESQTLCVIAALLKSPQTVIGDQIFGSLDKTLKQKVAAEFVNLAREKNTLFVLSMNDLNLTESVADHVILLKDGRIHAAADKREFFASPPTEYARSFVAARPPAHPQS